MRSFLKYGVLSFVLFDATFFLLGIAVTMLMGNGSVAGYVGAAIWLIGTVISMWVSVWFYMRKTRTRDIPRYIPTQEQYR